ncbi:MAG: Lrp/AsnC family transcriptional regulator [Candidatus Baltobacteraceae bacterium]
MVPLAEVTFDGVPVAVDDPVNAAILTVSEDRVKGFLRDPVGAISERSGVAPPVVRERIVAMLRAGTIRRVRQTLLATSLASGALVAWQIAEERLSEAFDFLAREDPFSGHVVIRTADPSTAGARYRLWTTLKVPQGYGLEAYARVLQARIGADAFKSMPAKKLFALGVGHVRRRGLAPGSRADAPAEVIDTNVVALDEREWQILEALKREFTPEELESNGELWAGRAREANASLDEFLSVASSFAQRGLIGRFSTFLEHVKPVAGNGPVTRYNALFHWRVALGREIDAGREVGRHHVITHAYWREGGPEFRDVNVMAVAHGLEKDALLEHKAAIDAHLTEAGIAADYTNVFWGGRSEIKPSEISPLAFRRFCAANGIDPEVLRA